MPLSETCVYFSHTKNIQGKDLILQIIKYEKAIDITVKYTSNSFMKRKIVILGLIPILMIFLVSGFTHTICIGVSLSLTFHFYNTLSFVKFERLIVVEDLGYQIEVHYNIGKSIQFISWNEIKSIFINEVLSKQRVLFILALLLHKDEKVNKIIPLFTNIMPRLQCLELIYQHIEHFHN